MGTVLRFFTLCTRLASATLAFAGMVCSLAAWANPERAGVPVSESMKQKQCFCSNKAQAGELIRHYLLAHPEVLVEAYAKLQKKEAIATEQRILSLAQTQKEAIFGGRLAPIAGNPRGRVEIVEFFDYQCGHCKSFSPVLEHIIDADPRVKLVSKELPIFGETSNYAARAALAAMAQKKYWQFHNALLAVKTPLTPENILQLAEQVGLSVTKLKADMAAAWVKEALESNIQLAEKLTLPGTPALFIRNVATGKMLFVSGALSLQALQDKITELDASRLTSA